MTPTLALPRHAHAVLTLSKVSRLYLHNSLTLAVILLLVNVMLYMPKKRLEPGIFWILTFCSWQILCSRIVAISALGNFLRVVAHLGIRRRTVGHFPNGNTRNTLFLKCRNTEYKKSFERDLGMGRTRRAVRHRVNTKRPRGNILNTPPRPLHFCPIFVQYLTKYLSNIWPIFLCDRPRTSDRAMRAEWQERPIWQHHSLWNTVLVWWSFNDNLWW